MTRVGRSWWVPLVAVVALVGSMIWMLVQGQGVGGWGQSDTSIGRVESLGDARTAAEAFAGDLGPGMGVGEVMQFDNQYYAEIVGADGELATEALVDPSSGTVQIEYGPARMWNTRYGMMAAGSATSGRITAAEAEEIADRWLADQGDLTADDAEELPGYYTLHTLRDGALEGMLSVNSTTGDVWYHAWHGQFVDMTEAQ